MILAEFELTYIEQLIFKLGPYVFMNQELDFSKLVIIHRL